MGDYKCGKKDFLDTTQRKKHVYLLEKPSKLQRTWESVDLGRYKNSGFYGNVMER